MARLPPLTSLRAFEAAGRLLSIRKAAAELFVTPAAVSRQVRSLEEHLGVDLFERDGRAIRLTGAGEDFLREITRSFALLRSATSNLMEIRGTRLLRIRAYTTFAMRWLIPRLSSFHDLHPEIDVKLTTSLEWMDFDRDDIDAAIRLGPGNWPGLQSDPLVPNELLPVGSRAACAALGDPPDPARLNPRTLLHTLARPDDWANWLRAAEVDIINPYAGRHYESSALAYQAAIEGHGFAMAQKVLVEDDLAAGRLVAPFSMVLDMAGYTYYFVFPLGRRRSPQLEAFRAWLSGQVEPR
jgi:LysR family glycine cleavage system transcriptional activator